MATLRRNPASQALQGVNTTVCVGCDRPFRPTRTTQVHCGPGVESSPCGGGATNRSACLLPLPMLSNQRCWNEEPSCRLHPDSCSRKLAKLILWSPSVTRAH